MWGETSRYEADFPVPPDRHLRCALETPEAQGISATDSTARDGVLARAGNRA